MAYNDNFDKLSSLKIFYPASTLNSATIYGNGRNQVEVMVGVKILDSDQKPLVMTEQELRSSIFLCDYYTGEKISLGDSPDWNYTNQKNEYVGALEYTSARAEVDNTPFSDDGYNYLKLYLYSNKRSDGKVIAAGINIPKVGDFNTTPNGTQTPNGTNSNASTFKMPGFITAKALEPYKYTKGDFSLNQEMSNIEPVSDQGTQLYNIRWTNYYLDISKPSHEILSLKASQSSGSLFGSHFAGWWIGQSFDCSADYGKNNISKTLTVRFSKYQFRCTNTINTQQGACFTFVNGVCTVPTSWNYYGQTYVDIIDQYGNHASPRLSHRNDHIELSGFYSGSRDISERTVQNVGNYGVPEDIALHIADNAPSMICGVLSLDDNNSSFKPCINVSPTPEKRAIIDSDSLQTLRDSHKITHIICSVPDALSHDLAYYQKMSDRDGLPYLLICCPSQQCLTIIPQTEFGYENRPYNYGQYDCYSLVRDYLLKEKGVALNDYPREAYSGGSGTNCQYRLNCDPHRQSKSDPPTNDYSCASVTFDFFN